MFVKVGLRVSPASVGFQAPLALDVAAARQYTPQSEGIPVLEEAP